MIVLYIIGAILALGAFVLFAPVTFELEYDETFNVKVRYLFIRYKIPSDDVEDEDKQKRKKKKEKKPKKKKAKTKEKEETKSQSSIEKNLGIIKTAFKFKGFAGAKKIIRLAAYAVKKVSRLVKRHLIIKDFQVVMAVGDDDAAQTAVSYGKTCAYVFPLLGLICNTMKVRRYHADIFPDFMRTKSRAYIYAKLKIRPIFVLGMGISALFKIIVSPLIKSKIDTTIKNKAVQQSDETEQK
ncbi:MAG: DUF2953 domain-containing protein [Clostridia bacterium]|nr:DUF2953 domain-containing protein [Clostridia bacterium]